VVVMKSRGRVVAEIYRKAGTDEKRNRGFHPASNVEAGRHHARSASSDLTLDAVLHQQLEHGSATGAEILRLPASAEVRSGACWFRSSVLLAPWSTSANSTIADALDGHPATPPWCARSPLFPRTWCLPAKPGPGNRNVAQHSVCPAPEKIHTDVSVEKSEDRSLRRDRQNRPTEQTRSAAAAYMAQSSDGS
jgi:hypothetical protein